ncbi:MAG: 23S rRNA pseudouridine(1911/1915/1917) synthase RluD [Pseudomonadota bacterium]
MATQTVRRRAQIPSALGGSRLDQAAAALWADFSRARLQAWIEAGALLVDGGRRRRRDLVLGGEWLELDARVEAAGDWERQAVPFRLVHEDAELLVVDKPAGVVVHPAAGNRDRTLLNGLLLHCPALRALPRAGIVHRLDKDTTGLLVVAKTLRAHTSLVAQLRARSVRREYDALVRGRVIGGGTVTAPIGRHPSARTRMAVVRGGREAVSHYRILRRFPAHTLLRVSLETGRTHQIRVHLAHLGHPLVGDPVYGGRLQIPAGAGAATEAALRGFRRQALHAARLALRHPGSGEEMSWEAPLPADFAALLAALAGDGG